MTYDELLGRFDEHLARSNEHMARGNELVAEVREEMRLNREERAESREVYASLVADMREFIREITVRIERVGADQIRELRDLRDESRAQRQALLRLIDRLGPANGGAAPA